VDNTLKGSDPHIIIIIIIIIIILPIDTKKSIKRHLRFEVLSTVKILIFVFRVATQCVLQVEYVSVEYITSIFTAQVILF
jgi:hypothetical protein